MLYQGSKTTQGMAGGRELSAEGAPRPWEDRSASALDRFESYKSVVISKVAEILQASKREGITHSERMALMEDPATQYWAHEQSLLLNETPEQFCGRIDRELIQKPLGKNFLGAEEWKAQGIDIGTSPPIPSSITKALLESPCPLHPGQKIKDTHILMLVPQTVNGEAYTALKLDELCAKRKGSGDKLIYDGADWARDWKECDWAKAAQAQSEWVLIPKSEPDPKQVRVGKRFRSKRIAVQKKVHDEHYPAYREVKALEVMTMALLYDLTHKEQLLPDYVRCQEPNARGGRVCVGGSSADGLVVRVGLRDNADDALGRALARKLQI